MLKADPRQPSIPVMIVTASPKTPFATAPPSSAPCAFITKPFRIFELTQRMRAPRDRQQRRGSADRAAHPGFGASMPTRCRRFPSPSTLRAVCNARSKHAFAISRAVVCAVFAWKNESAAQPAVGRSSTDALLGGAVMRAVRHRCDDRWCAATSTRWWSLLPEAELPCSLPSSRGDSRTRARRSRRPARLPTSVRWGGQDRRSAPDRPRSSRRRSARAARRQGRSRRRANRASIASPSHAAPASSPATRARRRDEVLRSRAIQHALRAVGRDKLNVGECRRCGSGRRNAVAGVPNRWRGRYGPAGGGRHGCRRSPPGAPGARPDGMGVRDPAGFEGRCARARASRFGTASRCSTRPARSTPITAARSKWCSSIRRQDPFVVRPGDRIAQLVIAPVAKGRRSASSRSLDATERGDGGYGSTGRGPAIVT